MMKSAQEKKERMKHLLNMSLYCIVIALLLLVLINAGYSWFTRPCTLCEHAPAYDLCLVDLHEGEVYELKVYDRDPMIDDEQPIILEGVMSLLNVGELSGYRDTSNCSAYVSVPAENAKIRSSHFCHDCCNLLSNDFSVGYMLADLSDPESPKVYPLLDGAVYQVRYYEVSVAAKPEKDKLEVLVHGMYSE